LEPGTVSGYHAFTRGYLLGELVRRITGKSLGTFFREEVTEPSGANFQPWRFMIITDSHIKKKVRKVCELGEKRFYSQVKGDLRDWLLKRDFDWKKPFLEEAPVLLLVLSDARAPYSTQSVWLAIDYILLVLEELGLITVTYTPSDSKAIQEEVGIPD